MNQTIKDAAWKTASAFATRSGFGAELHACFLAVYASSPRRSPPNGNTRYRPARRPWMKCGGSFLGKSEPARELWNAYEGLMLRYLQSWINQLRWQRLKPMEKRARMLVDHLDRILNYCRTKMRLGIIEKVHGNIKALWVSLLKDPNKTRKGAATLRTGCGASSTRKRCLARHSASLPAII